MIPSLPPGSPPDHAEIGGSGLFDHSARIVLTGAELEQARRRSRIWRLMASTTDWERWFWIDLEQLTVHVIVQPEWKLQENENA